MKANHLFSILGLMLLAACSLSKEESPSLMQSILKEHLHKPEYEGPILLLPDNTCGPSYGEILDFLCEESHLNDIPIIFCSYALAQMKQDAKCLQERNYPIFFDQDLSLIRGGIIDGSSPVLVFYGKDSISERTVITANNVKAELEKLKVKGN